MKRTYSYLNKFVEVLQLIRYTFRIWGVWRGSKLQRKYGKVVSIKV